MCDFEHSKALWYKVLFENSERTKHRSFLISWQYHTLELFISSGRVFEAYLSDDAVTDKPMRCPFCKSEIFIAPNYEEECHFAYHIENGCIFDDPIKIKSKCYKDAVDEWNRQVKNATV